MTTAYPDPPGVAEKRAYYNALASQEKGESEDTRIFDIPEPEVTAIEVDRTDERVPRGARTLINAAEKAGWTWRITYARGPRTHGAHGNLLGVSDSIKVTFRPPADQDIAAIATWVDGSMDTSWLVRLDREAKTAYPERSIATAVKALIKGES